jgi:hypothetical protein
MPSPRVRVVTLGCAVGVAERFPMTTEREPRGRYRPRRDHSHHKALDLMMRDAVERSRARGVAPPTETSKCSRCKLTKPRSEFYRDKRTPTGCQSACAECTKISQREAYARKQRGEAPLLMRATAAAKAAVAAEDAVRRAENVRLAAERKERSDAHLAAERAVCTPEWWAETMARLEREGQQKAREWAAACEARWAEKAREGLQVTVSGP